MGMLKFWIAKILIYHWPKLWLYQNFIKFLRILSRYHTEWILAQLTIKIKWYDCDFIVMDTKIKTHVPKVWWMNTKFRTHYDNLNVARNADIAVIWWDRGQVSAIKLNFYVGSRWLYFMCASWNNSWSNVFILRR